MVVIEAQFVLLPPCVVQIGEIVRLALREIEVSKTNGFQTNGYLGDLFDLFSGDTQIESLQEFALTQLCSSTDISIVPCT